MILILLGALVILALFVAISVYMAQRSSWLDVGVAWSITLIIAAVVALGVSLIYLGMV